MSNIRLDWSVYQNFLSAVYLALESAAYFEQCLPTGSLCPYIYTSCLLTQTEIALLSYFILHLFSGVPGMGSLDPESLLALQSIVKPGCAARREDGGRDGERITLTAPCAMEVQSSPWAVRAGEGGAQGSYSPFSLPA